MLMSVLDKLKGLLKGREDTTPDTDEAAETLEGNTKNAETTAEPESPTAQDN